MCERDGVINDLQTAARHAGTPLNSSRERQSELDWSSRVWGGYVSDGCAGGGRIGPIFSASKGFNIQLTCEFSVLFQICSWIPEWVYSHLGHTLFYSTLKRRNKPYFVSLEKMDST